MLPAVGACINIIAKASTLIFGTFGLVASGQAPNMCLSFFLLWMPIRHGGSCCRVTKHTTKQPAG